jgi:hypothetical protein
MDYRIIESETMLDEGKSGQRGEEKKNLLLAQKL